MTRDEIVSEVLRATPTGLPPRARTVGYALAGGGALGLGWAFAAGPPGAGWAALLIATTLTIGLAVVGVVLSAIYQVTGAKWGRAYRRLGEAGVVLMPLGLGGIVVLLLGGGGYLPWAHAHHLAGGKHLWLVRGFWDARVLGALGISYGLSLAFFRHSLRRDFCDRAVRKRLRGRLATWIAKDIDDPKAEAAHCERRLSLLAPIVLIGYALTFSLLGFDLIMALEPDWFSTLFGAWYFIGLMFAGLALLCIVSTQLRTTFGLERYLTEVRQRDLATVLFAFTLLNMDMFWSQYFTIWYANMPEETGWVIRRAHDAALPWHNVSAVALTAFFVIPFVALIFRRVKQADALLSTVATIVLLGVFLARFLEISPPLLDVRPPAPLAVLAVPLVTSALAFLGMLGGGLLLYLGLLTQVPIMPVGDDIFVQDLMHREDH